VGRAASEECDHALRSTRRVLGGAGGWVGLPLQIYKRTLSSLTRTGGSPTHPPSPPWGGCWDGAVHCHGAASGGGEQVPVTMAGGLPGMPGLDPWLGGLVPGREDDLGHHQRQGDGRYGRDGFRKGEDGAGGAHPARSAKSSQRRAKNHYRSVVVTREFRPSTVRRARQPDCGSFRIADQPGDSPRHWTTCAPERHFLLAGSSRCSCSFQCRMTFSCFGTEPASRRTINNRLPSGAGS
jgi:hypothetical protein